MTPLAKERLFIYRRGYLATNQSIETADYKSTEKNHLAFQIILSLGGTFMLNLTIKYSKKSDVKNSFFSLKLTSSKTVIPKDTTVPSKNHFAISQQHKMKLCNIIILAKHIFKELLIQLLVSFISQFIISTKWVEIVQTLLDII